MQGAVVASMSGPNIRVHAAGLEQGPDRGLTGRDVLERLGAAGGTEGRQLDRLRLQAQGLYGDVTPCTISWKRKPPWHSGQPLGAI